MIGKTFALCVQKQREAGGTFEIGGVCNVSF